MTIARSLIPEFDAEMATTRRMLERVPDDRADFRPHAKSTSLGNLAVHIAQLPWFVTVTTEGDEYDMAPGGTPAFVSPPFEGKDKVLALFDENVRKARAALETASDELAAGTWKLKAAGHTLAAMPRAVMWRTLGFSHIIHHRGQLSVYLRLNDVAVPSVYGPTADEQ